MTKIKYQSDNAAKGDFVYFKEGQPSFQLKVDFQ